LSEQVVPEADGADDGAGCCCLVWAFDESPLDVKYNVMQTTSKAIRLNAMSPPPTATASTAPLMEMME
jgi:hypothetical protein